ncbi:MAG: hypothetical protein RL156_1725 [Bacteroidota bacterium]|jgi:hypothetical protein
MTFVIAEYRATSAEGHSFGGVGVCFLFGSYPTPAVWGVPPLYGTVEWIKA